MHTDVTSKYLGIELRSPVVVGACPMTLIPETVRELAIAGAGAVVLPSLLEEQIVRRMIERGGSVGPAEQQLEAAGSAAVENSHNGGVAAYLHNISALKHHAGLPIIANLDGCTDGRWLDVAVELEQAGADALELSLHTDVSDAGRGPEAVEAPLLRAVETVCDSVSIPVSVKLLPFFTSLPNLAWRLAEVGAAGIVLFGREPIWDVHDGNLVATSRWTLSDAAQFQTTLSGLIRVRMGGPRLSVAASGGITTAADAVRAVIAGADVAMVASEIYRTGPDAVAHIVEGIILYLQRERYDAFSELIEKRDQIGPVVQSRRSQMQPMTEPKSYPESHVSEAHRTGDRWGHAVRSPLDD